MDPSDGGADAPPGQLYDAEAEGDFRPPVRTLTEDGTWIVTPFVRLARVHAANSAADAMIAVALAGSLFFSIDPDAARSRVLLYLLFTIAPFAIVGPFMGPAIDRAPGGRRALAIVILGLRAVAALAMIPYIDRLLLFPVAFANLVLGKSWSIVKASIVPQTVVSETELVDKNSRLAILTGVAGFVGAAPAVAAQWLFGSKVALALAVAAYLVAFAMAFRLPHAPREVPIEDDIGVADQVRTAGIRLSGSAMGVMRGIVGFMTFMIAFGFRGGTDGLDLSGMGAAVGAGVRNAIGFTVDTGAAPAWQLGIVLACNGVGALAGSLLAPRIRERTPEENLLIGGLALLTLFGVLATWTGGLRAAGILALAVGFAASASKVAFDAIVQRDALDADYGEAFARFETRFQIAWVAGALIPVVLSIPPRLGYFLVCMAALFAGVSLVVGLRTLRDSGSAEKASVGLLDRVRSGVASRRRADAEADGVVDGDPVDGHHDLDDRGRTPSGRGTTIERDQTVPAVASAERTATPRQPAPQPVDERAVPTVSRQPNRPSAGQRVGPQRTDDFDDDFGDDIPVPGWMDPSVHDPADAPETRPDTPAPPMWDDHR